jgi:hypothetical protein
LTFEIKTPHFCVIKKRFAKKISYSPNFCLLSSPNNMNQRIKFGTLVLLLALIPMAGVFSQSTDKNSNSTSIDSANKALNKEWQNFKVKAQERVGRADQKPALDQEYNQLVERLEERCGDPKANKTAEGQKSNEEGSSKNPRPKEPMMGPKD